VLTVQFQVHLLRPVSEGEMRAVGTVAHHSATLMVGESRVVDFRGREVGRGSGTFQKSRIPLTAEMGYA
jgi:acyl-coenzyme A thioesterase PaaI-like protein